jgi:hypothetical protein
VSEAEKRAYLIEWLMFALLFMLLAGLLLCRRNFTALVVSLERRTPIKLVLDSEITSERLAQLVSEVEQTPGVTGVDVISSATLQHILQEQEPLVAELDGVFADSYPVSINVAIDRSFRDDEVFALAVVDLAQLEGIATLMYDEKVFDKSREFVRFVYKLFRGALVLVFLSIAAIYWAARALGVRGHHGESYEGGSWAEEERPAYFTFRTIMLSIVGGLSAGIVSLAFLWWLTEAANIVLRYKLVFFAPGEAGLILFAATALRLGLDIFASRWQIARK